MAPQQPDKHIDEHLQEDKISELYYWIAERFVVKSFHFMRIRVKGLVLKKAHGNGMVISTSKRPPRDLEVWRREIYRLFGIRAALKTHGGQAAQVSTQVFSSVFWQIIVDLGIEAFALGPWFWKFGAIFHRRHSCSHWVSSQLCSTLSLYKAIGCILW